MELADYFAILKDSDAGCMKLIIRDGDGKAIRAAIFVDGVVETELVVNAVTKVEEEWEETCSLD